MYNYYCTFGKTLGNKIIKPPDYRKRENRMPNTMYFSPTNSIEVQQLIDKLNDRKILGHDEIQSSFLIWYFATNIWKDINNIPQKLIFIATFLRKNTVLLKSLH